MSARLYILVFFIISFAVPMWAQQDDERLDSLIRTLELKMIRH